MVVLVLLLGLEIKTFPDQESGGLVSGHLSEKMQEVCNILIAQQAANSENQLFWFSVLAYFKTFSVVGWCLT